MIALSAEPSHSVDNPAAVSAATTSRPTAAVVSAEPSNPPYSSVSPCPAAALSVHCEWK